MNKYPIISDEPSVQAHYEQCRENGTSHTLSEMFALARGPALMTDSVFMTGKGGCYDQFNGNKPLASFYGHQARKHGVDTTGKVYMHSLADFPGDPRAWISSRGEVKKLCEERGYSCEGAVNVRSTPREAPTGGGLATDIVERMVAERAGPGSDVQEVREKVIQQAAPHWAKKEVA